MRMGIATVIASAHDWTGFMAVCSLTMHDMLRPESPMALADMTVIAVKKSRTKGGHFRGKYRAAEAMMRWFRAIFPMTMSVALAASALDRHDGHDGNDHHHDNENAHHKQNAQALQVITGDANAGPSAHVGSFLRKRRIEVLD